ncbi:MAG: GWxTD domain-containing protein [Gemmatimonadetes bacterium]|nr:GWxTD domain-containing protein [Gemmatimonadota bacterium]MYB97785.1 GWxTD domain-containing protein [Gemmatimonadota bacterium]MYI46478.1 GWxTD domain-containing protein [Gemmatimonadota bacterium]
MTAPGLLLLLALAPSSGQPAAGARAAGDALQTASDPWQAGLELIEAGDVEGGLVLWIDSRDSLTAAGAEDPRIGVRFIEEVVEHGLGNLTEMATEMFYWGLSGLGPFPDEIRDEILAEGRRTFVLTDTLVAQYWERVGREDPLALAIAVKQFWIERDPTPTTPLNERLVEHWQRIAHARNEYVYNHSSPFRTDDRGVLYIKYGVPDRITRGHLGISSADQRAHGISDEDWARFDRQAQYEIWRYPKPGVRDFFYYLFGNVGGTGPFELVDGLHRLMPSNARAYKHRDIRFQYYLELFSYGDLARMGGPYGQRFAELERRWYGSRAPTEGFLEAASQQFVEDDRWMAREPRPSASSPLDDSPKSVLSAQVARVLAGGEPRLLVLAVSSPLWRPRVERGSVGDSLVLAPFAARHSVIIRDGRLEEITRGGMLPATGGEDLSTMVLRHPAAIRHVTVTAEHSVEGEEDPDSVGVLPGHAHFAVGPPLRRGESELEVSDLIVGLQPRPELPMDGVPVPLLPATNFWRLDLLRVYFEIYRPAAIPEGESGEFDVRIRIDRLEGPLLPDREAVGRAVVTVTIESPAPDGQHFFDLDLRNELPGDLRIVLEITDKATGVTRTRVTPVRLLAN